MAGTRRSSGGGRKPNLPANQKSTLTRILPPAELMGDVAVKLWKTQSKILIERGILELEDAPLLIAYCNAFHLMIEAEKIIAEDGLTDMGGMGGLKKHPAINVRNDSVSQLARLGSLLGLDPLSRIRMTGGGGDPDDEGNEFDEF
ncbi:phage terminase small subunit P27 family [Salmonella enterica]|uniref:Phage terminase small subunit P27 family n=1 Tax=Salmonella enterica TaxID=28901 RepID=A0A762BWC3_SALER|nr:phage terminase small subunit P27 family [Salmonella enterica]EDM9771413.1 phage terminase small subunit P27 family [Salmonella enterica subsp. enterica serovar Corvallis]EHB7345971.1 phage terminase small subunit P27 family [Salmonella enterica subsp. enterica serovar Bracknell]MLP06331.1 phage terminase small subunit P27 family [Salmonella enterica subsp. enterica serovar Kedougou]EBM1967284.1 phage terminase small subunit P27 family [Salmonella enterica]EIS0682976.1 phage terminase small